MICLDVRVERSQGFFLVSMSRPTQLVEQQADLVRCVVVCPSHFLELIQELFVDCCSQRDCYTIRNIYMQCYQLYASTTKAT
jgi:hypothetical protein